MTHTELDVSPFSIEQNTFSPLSLPYNVLVAASHGSAKIPEFVLPHASEDMKDPQYQGDFSDKATWGTKKRPGVVRMFNESNVIEPPLWGRAVGDANRPEEDLDFIAHTNFLNKAMRSNSVDVAHFPKGIPGDLRGILIEEHRAYHKRFEAAILAKLEETQESGDPVLVIDVHDTSNLQYETHESVAWRPGYFDRTIVSDQNHNAASQEVTTAFVEGLSHAYGKIAEGVDNLTVMEERLMMEAAKRLQDVGMNEIYEGGYTIQRHGVALKERLRAETKTECADRLHVLQVELPREEIMDPVTQKVYPEACYLQAQAIQQAAVEAVGLDPKDFVSL